MNTASRFPLGQLVARALERSWTTSKQQKLNFSPEEFDQVTPLLYESGAGGLGWWRIRETKLAKTDCGELLHQAHRLLTLRAAIHETRIQKAFRVLRKANIEPILIKGWAIARLYPELALRPYGDIDLLIRPADHQIAVDLIEKQARDCQIDFHAPAFELADRSLGDIYARTELVPCGSEQVRVLSAEDHFALLAVHLLKHGAWRPLWLCDLGLLLERMPNAFDWQTCLSGNRQRANWILSAVGLAHRLLDASIENPSIAERARDVPEWLIQNVLKQWETPFAAVQPPINYRAPMRSYLRRPRGVVPDLIRRWPSPIKATLNVNGTFGSRQRRRYQLGDCLFRMWRLLFHGSGAGRPFTVR